MCKPSRCHMCTKLPMSPATVHSCIRHELLMKQLEDKKNTFSNIVNGWEGKSLVKGKMIRRDWHCILDRCLFTLPLQWQWRDTLRTTTCFSKINTQQNQPSKLCLLYIQALFYFTLLYFTCQMVWTEQILFFFHVSVRASSCSRKFAFLRYNRILTRRLG